MSKSVINDTIQVFKNERELRMTVYFVSFNFLSVFLFYFFKTGNDLVSQILTEFFFFAQIPSILIAIYYLNKITKKVYKEDTQPEVTENV